MSESTRDQISESFDAFGQSAYFKVPNVYASMVNTVTIEDADGETAEREGPTRAMIHIDAPTYGLPPMQIGKIMGILSEVSEKLLAIGFRLNASFFSSKSDGLSEVIDEESKTHAFEFMRERTDVEHLPRLRTAIETLTRALITPLLHTPRSMEVKENVDHYLDLEEELTRVRTRVAALELSIDQ